MYAQYNQAANKTVYTTLCNLSNEERELNRDSYYGSLSGLFRHIVAGTQYFLNLFVVTLKHKDGILNNIGEPLPKEDVLSNEQWVELGKTMDIVDAAYAKMAESLTDADLKLPVSINWYGGKPGEVPLYFMLGQLLAHNTHHRGQISHILDTLKIEHDFSGIDVSFITI
jgi:uncharacterized damage-inducible protein DinB